MIAGVIALLAVTTVIAIIIARTAQIITGLTARTGPITIGQIARTGPAGRIGRMCAPVTAAPAAVAITGQESTPPERGPR
ncbi:predicted protein [Brucella sp. NVSL 07-0026]|nr:predicted protein [Brucella sp. NVSL 07-0026]